MYSKETLDRFKNPKFVGEMKDADAIGQEGNVRCGDIMKIFLKIDEEKDIIKDIKFQTYGCVAAISASALGVAATIVTASFCNASTFASSGILNLESRITLAGFLPLARRTVSSGSSVKIVPTPTITASLAARSL